LRILLSWLREWVEVPWPAPELAERLTMAGMEVEAWQEIDLLGSPDFLLEIKVTSNRGDALSLRGLAREVAAIAGVPLRPPACVPAPETEETVEDAAEVIIEAPDLCPRYSAQVIEGVTIRPSPSLVQARLEALGVRPINNIVDATNYVMLELGQPLHAFDLRLLAEGRIIVRRASPREVMATLDGVQRLLTAEDLVIADARRPVALAGVMGGESTEVRPDTQRVLIESANFKPGSVMRSSRRLGLASESSYRFERWVDPSGTVEAMNRAAALMCEWSGAKSRKGVIDHWPGRKEQTVIEFLPQKIRDLLGVEVSDEQQRQILERLGLTVQAGAPWKAVIPYHRNDVTIWQDLAEEVARIHGYNEIPLMLPRGEVQAGGYGEEAAFAERVKAALQNCGLTEIQTFSLVSSEAARLSLGAAAAQPVEARNPRSAEYSVLRTGLLASMLEVAAHNFQRETQDLYLFEVGKAYRRQGDELVEGLRAGILITGRNWIGAWNLPEAAADFYQLKGIVESALESLDVPPLLFQPSEYPGLEAGKAAAAKVGDAVVAHLGAVTEEAKRSYELGGDLWFAEIDLGAVAGLENRHRGYLGVPIYPPALRDLSVIAPVAVTYADLETIMRGAAGELLESVEVFDVYSGAQVPAGSRAVAVRLRFRSAERTLTDEEIEPLISEIVTRLECTEGVRVRRAE
jgi:phenylalanyl-tRNA synthetase beta chain